MHPSVPLFPFAPPTNPEVSAGRFNKMKYETAQNMGRDSLRSHQQHQRWHHYHQRTMTNLRRRRRDHHHTIAPAKVVIVRLPQRNDKLYLTGAQADRVVNFLPPAPNFGEGARARSGPSLWKYAAAARCNCCMLLRCRPSGELSAAARVN